jgi:hypothetical protein
VSLPCHKATTGRVITVTDVVTAPIHGGELAEADVDADSDSMAPVGGDA